MEWLTWPDWLEGGTLATFWALDRLRLLVLTGKVIWLLACVVTIVCVGIRIKHAVSAYRHRRWRKMNGHAYELTKWIVLEFSLALGGSFLFGATAVLAILRPEAFVIVGGVPVGILMGFLLACIVTVAVYQVVAVRAENRLAYGPWPDEAAPRWRETETAKVTAKKPGPVWPDREGLGGG